MINLTESKQFQINKNSSKGNQLKWSDNENWYKADFLGYEALSEYVVSHLLNQTSVPEHVAYELTRLSYQNKDYTGCVCKTFLKEGQEVITLEKRMPFS